MHPRAQPCVPGAWRQSVNRSRRAARPSARRGSVRHTDRRVDVLYVMIGSLRKDVESIGDRACREPLGDKARHLDFTYAEVTRMTGRVDASPIAHGPAGSVHGRSGTLR